MANKDYLLEIGLEEMPARFVTDAMLQLESRTAAWLKEKRIAYKAIASFSTQEGLRSVLKVQQSHRRILLKQKKGLHDKLHRRRTDPGQSGYWLC
nr:glycine--tRNA ligase subunit beta [Sinobaca sp. H24]